MLGVLGRNCKNHRWLIVNLTMRVRYEDAKDGKDRPWTVRERVALEANLSSSFIL